MDRAQRKLQRRKRAHVRVRGRVVGSSDRPRLAVYKSARYIYAQIIDDQKGETLVQANSREGEAKGKFEGGAKTKSAARLVGELIGERPRAKALRPWSSTAADTNITDGSRKSQKGPAPPDWSSESPKESSIGQKL